MKSTQPASIVNGLGALISAEIRSAVKVEVAASLRALGLKGAEYTTKTCPPEVTARTFNLWCRTGKVEGATPDGRAWRCSVEAWRKARAAGRKLPPKPAPLPSADDVEALAMISRSFKRTA